MILSFSVIASCSLLFIVPLVLDRVLTRAQQRFVETQEEVEDWTGADIPAAAQDVRFESFVEFSNTLWLRFEIADRSALDAYLAELDFDAELVANDNPFTTDIRDNLPRWWRPTDAAAAVGGEVTLAREDDAPRTISVLVEQSSSMQTVYIRFYENH